MRVTKRENGSLQSNCAPHPAAAMGANIHPDHSQVKPLNDQAPNLSLQGGVLLSGSFGEENF